MGRGLIQNEIFDKKLGIFCTSNKRDRCLGTGLTDTGRWDWTCLEANFVATGEVNEETEKQKPIASLLTVKKWVMTKASRRRTHSDGKSIAVSQVMAPKIADPRPWKL